MKVTHLVRSDAWAGVERHVVSLAVEQAERGHVVQVMGGDPASVSQWLGESAVAHTAVRTLLQAVRALEHTDVPDILHVHMTAAEVAAALSRHMRGVPVVSTRHFASVRGTSRLSRPAVQLARRRVTAQIAVSQYVADHVDGDSTVILAGVATHDDVPATERDRVVLVAQRLQPEKNTELALEAFAHSGLASEGWQLHIAGDGPLRSPLEELASRLRISDSTRFLGLRHDIERLMARAGLLIAPRDDEAYGLSVVEAMAMALPVVAAGSGGHLETIGRVHGAALFRPGDARGAAALLSELASDTSRREAYGNASRQTQRELFTMAAQARATDDVYRRVL